VAGSAQKKPTKGEKKKNRSKKTKSTKSTASSKKEDKPVDESLVKDDSIAKLLATGEQVGNSWLIL
jgi:hypothetical protein